MYSFVNNDFSVLYVARNSNSAAAAVLPRRGAVGRARGLAAAVDPDPVDLERWRWPRSAAQLPETFSSRVLGVMGLVSCGFLLFTLWTSNPFMRLMPAAQDGADLNPVLQDFALAIHPPMLYTGYVGFSVAFAFAVRGHARRPLDQSWAKWTRPWTTVRVDLPDLRHRAGQLVGLLRTGLGRLVVLGSGRERLVHAVAGRHGADPFAGVTEKRGIFKSWTLLLAIFAFSLSLVGTFLVRSGVLVSVHSFATDPRAACSSWLSWS